MNNERDSKASRPATDPIFKQIITDFFRGWDVDIQTEVEVGRLPRRIDASVRVAEHVQFSYLLHPAITEEVAMANRFRLPRRNMELIAQYLGRDLVPFINPEDLVHDLTPAQRLEGLSLEDIRDNLSDEDRQALRQLLDGQENDT